MIVDLVLGAGHGKSDMMGEGSGERVVEEHQEGFSGLYDLTLRDIQCRAVSPGEIEL